MRRQRLEGEDVAGVASERVDVATVGRADVDAITTAIAQELDEMQFDLAMLAEIDLLPPIQNRLRTKRPQLVFELRHEGPGPDGRNRDCHSRTQHGRLRFHK